MARKRVQTSPDEMGAVPQRKAQSSPQFSIGGGGGGGAVGPSAGAQMAASLSRFNPALKAFGQTMISKRDTADEAGAMKYLDTLEQSVSDHSVEWKKALEKEGAPQWRNGYIYRNALVTTGKNFATRDANKIRGNVELSEQLNALTKTTDATTFEAEAINLIERGTGSDGNPFFPLERNVEKGGDKYWEYGYGPQWLKERSDILAPYQQDQAAYEKTEIRRTFFEQGRSLVSQLVSGDPDKWTTNYKSLRKFINHQYGGYPGREFAYSHAVFDNIIYPVFIDLAKNPDNDVKLQEALIKVMGMTRDTKDGGRTQLWKKHGDVSAAATRSGSVQTLDNVLDALQKMEDEATNYQTAKEATNRQEYARTMGSLIKHWDTMKDEDEWKPILQKNGAYDVENPYDEGNWETIISAVMHHPQFQMSSDVSAAETKRTLLDAAEIAKHTLNKFTYEAHTTDKNAKAALLDSMETAIGEAHDTILDAFLPDIRAAIGGGESMESVEERILAALDTEKMEASYYAKRPGAAKHSIPYVAALKSYIHKSSSPVALATARQLAHTARAKLGQPGVKQDEYSILLAGLKDAKLEVNDNELDSEIGSIIDELEKATELAPYLKISNSDLTAIMEEAWSDPSNQKLMQIVALWDKAPKPEGDLVLPTAQSYESEEQMAAHQTMLHFHQITKGLRSEAVRHELSRLTPADRTSHWEDRGKAEARKNALSRLKSMSASVVSHYDNLLLQSEEEQAAVSKGHRINLSPSDQDALDSLQILEKQFLYDETDGIGGMMLSSKQKDGVLDQPKVMLEFLAGPAGQQRYSHLQKLKREGIERRNTLAGNLYTARNKLAKLQSGEDGNGPALLNHVANKHALERVETCEAQYKAHYFAFEGVDWRKLGDREGYNLEVPQSQYDPGGEQTGGAFSILINPYLDQLNMETTLIFTSPEDMENVGHEITDWETVNGGPNAEIDPETASDDLKLHAKVVQNMHGFDLLARDPANRKAAHRKYSNLNKGQLAMMYTRQPEKMGYVHAVLEEQALRQFADPTANYQQFQGEKFSEDEKDWLQETIDQRDAIGADTYNIERGITGPEAKKLVSQLVGGADHISKYLYQKHDHMRAVGRRNDRFGLKPVRDYTYTGDQRSAKKNVWVPGKPSSPEEVIAEQMAMTLVGIPQPITHDEFNKKRKEGVFLWTPGVQQRDEKGNPVTELTAEKYERLKQETKRITTLLKSGMPSPELARLYNRLVVAEGDYFENKYDRKNIFGIQPLLIPETFRATEDNEPEEGPTDMIPPKNQKLSPAPPKKPSKPGDISFHKEGPPDQPKRTYGQPRKNQKLSPAPPKKKKKKPSKPGDIFFHKEGPQN